MKCSKHYLIQCHSSSKADGCKWVIDAQQEERGVSNTWIMQHPKHTSNKNKCNINPAIKKRYRPIFW